MYCTKLFHNETAQTQFNPTYVHDVPLLPLHLEHLQKKQKAKEHIKKVEKCVIKWTEKKQIVGIEDEVKDVQQLCQRAIVHRPGTYPNPPPPHPPPPGGGGGGGDFWRQ